jgi:CDGSH-type Zn-finger protein
MKVEKEKIFLCRCGGSNNKPFCDGTHKKIEFKG